MQVVVIQGCLCCPTGGLNYYRVTYASARAVLHSTQPSRRRSSKNNIVTPRPKQHLQTGCLPCVKLASRKWWHWMLLAFTLLLGVHAVLLWWNWPFTRERLTVSLERA